MMLSTVNMGTVEAADQKISSNTLIKVAIEDSRALLGGGYGIPKEIWDNNINYSWIVNDRQYTIQTTSTNLTTLQNWDELNESDVLVMSGMQDEHIFLGAPILGYTMLLWTKLKGGGITYEKVNPKLIRNNLLRFVNESKKGFVGHCSGSVLPVSQYNNVKTTFVEKMIQKNAFLMDQDTRVRSLVRAGLPVFDEHYSWDNPILNFIRNPRGDPQAIGQMAYLYYSGVNMENETHHFGGFPVDLIVRDTSHPVLNGFFGDTLPVRYGAGPALYVPADDTDVSRLFDYPDGIGNDQWTKVIAWRFPFIQGKLVRRFFYAFTSGDTTELSKYLLVGDVLGGKYNWQNFPDWKQKLIFPAQDTEIVEIEPELSNQHAILAFNYPEGDEEGGRIFLSCVHEDCQIWSREGNYLTDMPDTEYNTLYNGLNTWRNSTTNDLLTEDDKTEYVNAWLNQREIAWAAKVPDPDMPPVYGASQVVDIKPELIEDTEFTIECCVIQKNGDYWNTTNLSLFYRYIGANSSYQWTDWTCYDSINSTPYCFDFDISQAMGAGRYEFCSILNTTTWKQEGSVWTRYDYNESLPPGPDAWCGVGEDIIALFTYQPQTAYVNTTLQFHSESLTKEGTYISHYAWDFGDDAGRGAYGENMNHSYEEPGVYLVNLTVKNSLLQTDTALVNITILNNPPVANFTVDNTTVRVQDSVTFTDTSSDVDGVLVNWTWDFGDGSLSFQQHPSHQYNSSNYYTVTVQVRDNDQGNGSVTKTDCILVVDSIVNGSIPNDIPGEHTWRSIQNAVNHSMARDMVYIYNGTYHENLSINKSMVLIGCSQEGVILNGSVVIINPFDYELPVPYTDGNELMNGTELLMHFNNDSEVEEEYHSSPLVYDYSGQGNNGTLYGAQWSTDTIKGQGCFSFDGINDSINLCTIPALEGETCTISAWVSWNEGSGTEDPVVSQVIGQSGYCLFINQTSAKPVFRLNTTQVVSSSVLPSGWHHLVGTHNSTTLSIYIDGVQTGSVPFEGNGIAGNAYIGYENTTDYYAGLLDEIAIWNRSLSETEITLLYQNNFGVYLDKMTILNAAPTALTVINHTWVSHCQIQHGMTGILIKGVYDVRIASCNITDCTTGISVNASCPEEYDPIQLVDCVVDMVTHGIFVNSSRNVTIIRVLVNGSDTNLTITDGTPSDVSISMSSSFNNVAPDTPVLTGDTLGDPGILYTYLARTNDSNDDQLLYRFDWDDGTNTSWLGYTWSNEAVQASHGWVEEGGYYVTVTAKDVFNNESEPETLLFKTETLPPLIHSVNHTPDLVGFGGGILFTANVTDDMSRNYSAIRHVILSVSYPDASVENFTMGETEENIYVFNFTDTWLVGRYDFTVLAVDMAYNENQSSTMSFNVSANAMISIATLQDSYTGDEYINITDPPNPPENYTLVGRGLTWDEYYNALTGQNILETYQGPVNYQEENGTWTPINNTIVPLPSNHPAYVYGYRNGNDHGLFGAYFKSNAQQEWPVAFTYNKSEDPTVHAIRSKLVGVGYVDPQNNWAYQYLQNVQYSQGQTNDYSITYPGVFTGTDVTWSYGNTGLKEEITLSNTTKTMLQNHPPSQYSLNDASSYLVFITKLDYQNLNLYNGSGLLNGNITISDTGVDFKDVLGQFRCALPLGEAYELNNDSIRERLTYRIIHLNGNTYLLSGLKVSKLNEMTFPVVIDPTLTVYSTTNDGYIHKSSTTSYNTAWSASSGTVYSSADYLTIGQKKGTRDPPDYNVYRSFVFFNTSTLPSNAYLDNATLSIYKRDDYSTTDFAITIQNGQPTYPHDPLQSGDYNKSCYLGNGGSLNTASLTSGYNAIPLNNLTWINPTGMTKLCLRSSRDISGTAPTGNEYVNVYSRDFIFSYPPKLVIYYRNQSKIKNTGETDVNGYLLIQVQFYETGKGVAPRWVVDNDTVNETTPRTITSGNQLALDTIFNGQIRASELTHGTGTYRVYTAFRDPEGNILRTNDDVDLEAWWQFNKT